MHHRGMAVIGFKGIGHEGDRLRRKQAAILRDSRVYQNPKRKRQAMVNSLPLGGFSSALI